MALQSNPQLELAFEYVCYTDKNVYLTGKAGTGKTTFLHRLKMEPVKRMAVVAPTGVAAINAGGMTIHSFFQLPFGPFVPGNSRDVARQRKFSGEKIRLIRSLDLLVIDEISMVRADLLDGIDDVLRRYKNPYQPFGGVQLLMIGDLHQLPPVVKDEEWYLLREHYQTPYFFSSQALQQAPPVVITLTHIFRQSDGHFIELLNKVRDNALDSSVLETLNSRFVPDFEPDETEGYITLTTHNASAQAINSQKLAAVPGAIRRFEAQISGNFPEHAYPTDQTLELKVGAQVMFVKNDSNQEKRFYNGKIGRITDISENTVYVLCPGDPEVITVGPMDWENIQYALNEQSKEVTETVVGTFTQHPLKLAWAITIHKSQGLTFERVILDAQAAFAHGQVYVALSRCKSFEGIVLCSKIVPASVRTDSTVKNFSDVAGKNAPDEAQLQQSKAAFQQALILDLFSLNDLKKYLAQLRRVLLEHENALEPDARTQLEALNVQLEGELYPVVDRFRPQLLRYFREAGLPEANEALQERIQKGGTWFSEKISADFLPAAKNIQIITDNKSVRKSALEALERVQKEFFVKNTCFAKVGDGFSTHLHLRAKADAELDFQAIQPKPAVGTTTAPVNTEHPELFARLAKWRRDFADMHGLEAYQVLFTKTILEIVRRLPADLHSLQKIKGIGKSKRDQFGAEVIGMVLDYCAEKKIQTAPIDFSEPEPEPVPKPDTKALSFELFKSGKTIDEIAAERGFVRSTIEGHLGHFVALGELDIFELIPEEDVRKIEAFFSENQTDRTTEAKEHFGEAYSYGELRLVVNWMKGAQAE